MVCIKCRKNIPDESLFCNFCGKKQVSTKVKYHKRANGTGTITKDKRYRNQYIAHAPSSKAGAGRIYIGSFPTLKDAQNAVEKYIREGKSDLYNATLADIYEKWSDTHFRSVSDSAISLYSSMWKRFSDIQYLKMRDIRTSHFQDIVNRATSKSACDIIKAMAVMLCRFAVENDIINKNYAEFVKVPKFEKKEKNIFSREDIEKLWEHSDNRNVQIILFMIYTGLRIGEMMSLKVINIHLEDGYIICGEKTEAGRNRVVPLPENIPELKGFMQVWINESDGENLFRKSVSQFRRDFYSTLKEYGFEKHYTPHSTRHTFASISASSGIQPENLQKIIGHSDFSTTANIYVHQDIETLCKEMKKISK